MLPVDYCFSISTGRRIIQCTLTAVHGSETCSAPTGERQTTIGSSHWNSRRSWTCICFTESHPPNRKLYIKRLRTYFQAVIGLTRTAATTPRWRFIFLSSFVCRKFRNGLQFCTWHYFFSKRLEYPQLTSAWLSDQKSREGNADFAGRRAHPGGPMTGFATISRTPWNRHLGGVQLAMMATKWPSHWSWSGRDL